MERVAGRAKTKRRRRTGRRRRGLVLVEGGGGEGGSRNGLIAILLDQDLYDIHLDYLSRRGKGGWRGGLDFVGRGGRSAEVKGGWRLVQVWHWGRCVQF